jgi:(+)-neomenthol dehydrogenase
VVTGSNKGIGLETCCQLLYQGVKVILTARDEAKGAVALEKLRASAPADVVFHQLDVTDSRSVEAFADFIKTQFGRLDILVMNTISNSLFH